MFRKAVFLLFTILLISCARVEYLVDQGSGQLSLLMDGVSNDVVLRDSKVKSEDKDKIKKIREYKAYFYSYFKRPATDIYEETVFLNRNAVTYLVVASPFNEIKPKKECFFLVGCFPYLGFFSEQKAHKHARDLNKDDYATYVRPVLAYSTLGYFDDNILSTFFQYEESDLANLIFHELFHTIFFVKGEVELNENLAMFFADQLEREYFSYSESQILEIEKKKAKGQKVKHFIVTAVKRLREKYKESSTLDRASSEKVLNDFLRDDFTPRGKALCESLSINNCAFVKRKWNNASFSAFLTYENKIQKIKSLFDTLNVSLVDFYGHIETKYRDYRKKGLKMSFASYLLEK